MTGITAAQALANASIDDFLILEYRDRLGGRLRHAEFGEDENGNPYVVELGANWVCGLRSLFVDGVDGVDWNRYMELEWV